MIDDPVIVDRPAFSMNRMLDAPSNPPHTDLNDDEWASLETALASASVGGDASALDGYLFGLLLQAEPPALSSLDWWAHLNAQAQVLIARRWNALHTALRTQAWWDPFIRAEPTPSAPDETVLPAALLSPQLAPWIAGMDQALQDFPLPNDQADDPGMMLVFARLYRHLPAPGEPERELVALLDEAHPLLNLEDAVDDLVACASELWDLTRPLPG